jgi:hypothetical protein
MLKFSLQTLKNREDKLKEEEELLKRKGKLGTKCINGHEFNPGNIKTYKRGAIGGIQIVCKECTLLHHSQYQRINGVLYRTKNIMSPHGIFGTSYSKNYYLEGRKKLIELMGGKCVKCNFSDWRALQIDHINGKGGKEIKEHQNNGTLSQYYKNIELSFLAGLNEYQLLCANCNWIKRSENKECKL